jgi:uncharacterized protein (DUF362 family)
MESERRRERRGVARTAAGVGILVFSVFLGGCPKREDPPKPAPAASASVPVDVVASASPAYDAGPAVTASGEVDGDALRARIRKRIAADTSPVTILRGGDPRSLGERICKAKVPDRAPETPVLIKPNLGGFEWFRDPEKSGGDDGVHGRTTDVEFVRGIVRCLKARGHTTITIAEGFGHTHKEWERLLAVSGYGAMAREEKVTIVGMNDDGVFDVQGDQPGKPLRIRGMEKTHHPTLLMPKVLADHLERGLYISAPKIKAHRFGVVSIAIKGMQGTVMLSDASPAFHQKWRSHKELPAALKLLSSDKEAGKKAYLDSLHVFAERMVDVLEVEAPDVVLAEGAPAMGGDGFGKRWPSAEDVAIGGTNPVLVDRAGALLLGLWDNDDLARELGGHKTSPLIEIAAKRLSVDLGAATIDGDGAALLATKRPVHYLSMSGFSLLSDDRPAEARPRPWTKEAPREAKAKRIEEGAIAIDGKKEAAWDAIPAVSFDTDWAGATTGTPTSVRFAWSPKALTMLWEVDEAGINADASRPTDTERAKLYEEDCVEIFLAPDAKEPGRYYELEVGPLGHFLDVAIDRSAKKSDVAWSAEARIATQVDRDKKHVTIEVSVPAAAITKALAPGARLPLGLYRMEGRGQRKFLAWSPTRTPRPDFHVPSAFGTLVVE